MSLSGRWQEGTFRRATLKLDFFFDDPGDPSLSVSPVSGSGQPNLIYGTELGDQLTGGPSQRPDHRAGRNKTSWLVAAGNRYGSFLRTVSDSPVGEGNRDVILDFDALNDVIDLSAVSPALGFEWT